MYVAQIKISPALLTYVDIYVSDFADCPSLPLSKLRPCVYLSIFIHTGPYIHIPPSNDPSIYHIALPVSKYTIHCAKAVQATRKIAIILNWSRSDFVKHIIRCAKKSYKIQAIIKSGIYYTYVYINQIVKYNKALPFITSVVNRLFKDLDALILFLCRRVCQYGLLITGITLISDDNHSGF